MLFVASLIRLFSLLSSQRSIVLYSTSPPGLKSPRCGMQNLTMLQSFCWNRFPATTSFQLNTISDPVDPPMAAHCLKASEPYCLTTASGITILPRLLLIFCPSSPSTIPFITISSQGRRPVSALARRMV